MSEISVHQMSESHSIDVVQEDIRYQDRQKSQFEKDIMLRHRQQFKLNLSFYDVPAELHPFILEAYDDVQ